MKVFRFLGLPLLGIVLFVWSGLAQSTIGIIGTVAGNGAIGNSGDGGPATAAELNLPLGVAVDAAGNLYIADDLARCVRKVSPAGIISTVAGNGTKGFSGDGGSATAAQLQGAWGVAVDSSGNLYIADGGNQRIRKVTSNGIITTIAGSGPTNPNPGAGSFGGDGGPATSATLNSPSGLALDAAGNLFIADANNNRIRKVDTQGIITTVVSGLNYPQGVAVDTAGNIYIADTSNSLLRKFTPSGTLITLAGNGTPGASGDGGPATAAELLQPNSVALDAAGNVYVSVSGIVGGGGFTPPTASDARVRKVSPAGIITTVAGNGGNGNSGDGGPATAAALCNPNGIVVDGAGDLFIASCSVIREVAQVTPLAATNSATLTAGTLNLTYSQALSASGGRPPYLWAVASGSLPPGLSLNSATGVISGSPAGSAGTFSFTLKVTDSLGTAVSQASQIVINPLSFAINQGGALSLKTQDLAASVQTGYGVIQAADNTVTPAGLAIFGFTENNILVTEAAVPASPLIQGGRIYAQVNGPVNTGLAIANPNNTATAITFYFTDVNGNNFAQGSTVIPAGGQIAKFLTEAPFSGGSSIQGTFTFTSTQPVAAVALRGFTNQRSEFLITTLPVSPLVATAAQPVIFPHFADGLGWTSQVVLVNPTDTAMGGTMQFFGQGSATTAGQAISLTVNGQTASSFSYSIPPRSSASFQTSGTSATLQDGSVRVIPDNVSTTPAGVLIFSYVNGGITVTQAGVPAVPVSGEFRMYAEASGNFANSAAGSVQTGIAIANPSSNAITVNLALMTLAGASTGLTGTVQVPAQGQTALFLSQVPGFAALPNPFQGVLQLSTASSGLTGPPPFSVIGLRGRYNQRGDFLITTTAPVPSNSSASSASLFIPQFVDGGGYTTQLILFSGLPGFASSGTIQMFTQAGAVLNLPLQ